MSLLLLNVNKQLIDISMLCNLFLYSILKQVAYYLQLVPPNITSHLISIFGQIYASKRLSFLEL